MKIERYADAMVLVVSIGSEDAINMEDFKKIIQSVVCDNHLIIEAKSMENAVSVIKDEAGLSCIIIHDQGEIPQIKFMGFIKALTKLARVRNPNIPIFFASQQLHLYPGFLFNKVAGEFDEYINVSKDTPSFIAGRINLAIKKYRENLLPPYFSALKDYATDSPYYWDCPGHQGGVAYLKHPIGREFINYFGENIMRADIGIATPEMGDWLEHKGPPGASEKKSAELFGAERTFYVTGGSSQSNQIVGHSLPLKDCIVLVDRNCHKSINHELTVAQARPVYFNPSRNGYGIIGLIPPDQFEWKEINRKINVSPLSFQEKKEEPVYAIITNCTYDGLIYDVPRLVDTLGESVPRLKFDEAWYAYAKFHPLYKNRFAMAIPTGNKNTPTLYAVQSTHKMLAALSSASMIHVRSSDRAPVNYDAFNQSFMMHGTTSPFYPIIASLDVASAMMEGESGRSLLDEAIEDALNLRKTIVLVAENMLKKDPCDWFFGVWQPTTLFRKGKAVPFTSVPNTVLATDATCWLLQNGESWHGFNNLPEGYAMLDPIKVTITCPGVDAQGCVSDFGIPAAVVAAYLDTKRVIPARYGDYTILILFALGSTEGKWNTLIDLLLMFKHQHDSNHPLTEVLPDIADGASCYQDMGLADLCRAMHQMNLELNITELAGKACGAVVTPVLKPSEAWDELVADNTELVSIDHLRNRTLAVMVTPYPPGIPLIMPGEKVTEESMPIVDYLRALQTFDKQFPGFEHELQGVEIDKEGNYWLRCIKEKECSGKIAIPRLCIAK